MNIKDFKLVICRQDHDNEEISGTSIEEYELSLDINSITNDNRVPDDTIIKLFDSDPHTLTIYDKKNVSEDVSWIFLKSEDASKNYFCHVVSMLTK